MREFLVKAGEGAEAVNELPIPAEAFGLVALAILGILAAVTFSYRNVAHRHAEKPNHDSGH